jgi:MoaA/NifB/PqqE/SkfB family radical SAM enzyme
VAITLFGGEPLLHPEFVDWALYVKSLWGPDPALRVNTNGYYLQNIIDNLEVLFAKNIDLSVVLSIQTASEPYLSTVTNLAEKCKNLIFDFRAKQPDVKQIEWVMWQDDIEKKWYNLHVNGLSTNISFVVAEMYKLTWCTHYDGYAEEMKPVYDYNDIYFEENHNWCQAKPFVTLYKGDLYKCPPIGVLEHTLNTFKIQDLEIWTPYIKEYKKLQFNSTESEIVNWFETQKKPEKVCNMCGFAGPKNRVLRGNMFNSLKSNWKYPIKTN